METKAFVERYPKLFHMAEAGYWASIRKLGLLSTSAVLDQIGLKESERAVYETQHRPEKIALYAGAQKFILRDQKPMPPERISRAFSDGTTPEQWYEFLNGKVFMWAEETRLLTLLNARAYRSLEHDVLTIDTTGLVAEYEDKVSLCRMNSGNTFPYWHERSFSDFMKISQYPTRLDGMPKKPVVEVVVDYSIPNIKNYVTQVRRMKGLAVLSDLAILD